MKNVVSLCVVAVAGVLLHAAGQSPTVFRSGVQYVRLDVVVTDKDDRPVGDLKKDEFEIVENGRRQTIADFDAVSIPAVMRSIAVNTPPEPQPDVATNLPAAPDSRLFTIVVDDLHLIEQDTLRIKRTLTDLVNAFSPNDEVALVFVNNSRLGVNFTHDTTAIMARIENIKAALGFGLDSMASGPDKPVDDTGPKAGGGSSRTDPALAPPSKFRLNYARSAIQTLSSVVKAMAGSSHSRRAVFFVTGGTTLDPFQNEASDPLNLDSRILVEDYKQAFADAQRADVPIYVVDPRGNMTADDAVRCGMCVISARQRSALVTNIRVQHDNMAAIAVNTGGRAIFNASDMTRMMQEIVQDNGSYYLLGYYPEPFAADGKFHDVKVHVSRPGTRVRARPGYEAPAAPGASAAAVDAATAALNAGVSVSGLPLGAFVSPTLLDGGKSRLAITIEVSYPPPTGAASRLAESLDVRVAALDADGAVKASAAQTLKFGVTTPASGVKFLINEVLDAPAQPLTLRVAVASAALGKAGSVQTPVDVVKSADGKIRLGGIALGLDGPATETVMRADAFAGLMPIQPTVAREFSATDVLRLFGHVYWKDGNIDPIITTTLTGPSGTTTSTPSVSRVNTVEDQDGVIAAMLPLKGLSPGRYHLAVQAALPGGKPAVRDVLFEVK